jgi:hypothetical protein
MSLNMRAAKHTPHDNGGAAGNWKVLSIRPPLRGAMAFGDIPLPIQRGFPYAQEKYDESIDST